MPVEVRSAAPLEPGTGERGAGRCWGGCWRVKIWRLVSVCVGGKRKRLGAKRAVRGGERISWGVQQEQYVCARAHTREMCVQEESGKENLRVEARSSCL